jgi:hypothetical protein
MSNVEVIPHQPREVAPSNAALTPMEMLSHAVERGADPVLLEKLMALSERWEANQARKAFNDALAKASANFRPVVKNATGHNNRKYADLAAVENAVKKALNDEGLRYNFTSRQESGQLAVTCHLSHRDGHVVENTLMAAPDNSGSKNAIQAVGSASSYLCRYTLVQALGLSFVEDDDGHAAIGSGSDAVISPEEVTKLRDALKFRGGHEQRFLDHIKVDKLENIRADKFEACLRIINGVRA